MRAFTDFHPQSQITQFISAQNRKNLRAISKIASAFSALAMLGSGRLTNRPNPAALVGNFHSGAPNEHFSHDPPSHRTQASAYRRQTSQQPTPVRRLRN